MSPWGAAYTGGATDIGNPSALVIGLDTLTGLQTCRTLARRGVRVVGIVADQRHPACWTNACSRLVVAPTAGEPLLVALEALADSEAGAVLFPCTDASVSTLSHAAGRLRAFRLLVPSPEVLDILSDLRRFTELAETHGIPTPPTVVVTDAETARVAAGLAFPCRVRPAINTPRWEAAGPPVRDFEDPSGWLAEAERLLELHSALVVQERPAPNNVRYSCTCYVSPHGMPILTFLTRSLRRCPPQLRTSSLEETSEDEHVRDIALDVLSCLPFVGIATVESEGAPAPGTVRVVGISVGRPTEASAIVEAGGVELLYTMYCDAVGAPLPFDRRQHDRPVKGVRFVPDFYASRQGMLSGGLSPAAWRRSLDEPRVSAVVDISDLAPFGVQVVQWLRSVARYRPGRAARPRPVAPNIQRPGDERDTRSV